MESEDLFFDELTEEEIEEFIQEEYHMMDSIEDEVMMTSNNPDMEYLEWNQEGDEPRIPEERMNPVDLEEMRALIPAELKHAPTSKLSISLKTDSFPLETSILLYDVKNKMYLPTLYPTEPNKVYSYTRWLPDSGCSVLQIIHSKPGGLSEGGIWTVRYGNTIKYGKPGTTFSSQYSLGTGCINLKLP